MISLIQTLFIALLTKVLVLGAQVTPQQSTPVQAGDEISSTVSITQNASGRLGALDTADEQAYRQAKETLRNPLSTKKQLRKAGKTLKRIYHRRNAEMRHILKEVTAKTGATFTLEKAGGAWLGGEEYSFKVSVQAPTQASYDRALQAISYVAEAARQDAFIENLGTIPDTEVTDEKLLRQECTLFLHIPFSKTLNQREMAIVQDVFTQESTEDLPLDATITDKEIYFSMPTWKLGDNPTTEGFKELADNWTQKIISVFTHGKEGKLKGLVGQTCQPTYERSRFHSADNAYSEDPTRNYASQRNHYLSERHISQESGAALSAAEGQEIKSHVEKTLGIDRVFTSIPHP